MLIDPDKRRHPHKRSRNIKLKHSVPNTTRAHLSNPKNKPRRRNIYVSSNAQSVYACTLKSEEQERSYRDGTDIEMYYQYLLLAGTERSNGDSHVCRF